MHALYEVINYIATKTEDNITVKKKLDKKT